jgi:hypothetical protein
MTRKIDATPHANTSIDFLKTHLTLCLATSQLIQQSHQQWLILVTERVNVAVEETQTTAEELRNVKDWQTLARLPASALWHAAQGQVGHLQAYSMFAVSNQAAYISAVQMVFQSWQQTLVDVFTSSDLTAPVGKPLF